MIVGILHVLYSDLKGTATAVYVDKGLVPVRSMSSVDLQYCSAS